MLKLIKTNKYIRSLVQKLLGNKMAVKPYSELGLKLHFPAGKYLSFYFSKYASTEPVVANNLKKIIRNGDTVYDVGANIGYYTLLFSKWNPTGKVYAFEPDPENIKNLNVNITSNSLKNVTIVQNAVSDFNGTATFFQDLNTGRTSGLIENVFHPGGIYKQKKIEVDVIKLDDCLSKYSVPNVIKCDIEGNEARFLKGAQKLLEHTPLIIMEVLPENWAEVFEILTLKGYLIVDASVKLSKDKKTLSKTDYAENILAFVPGKHSDVV